MDHPTPSVVSDLETRLDSLKQTIRKTAFIEGAARALRLACLCVAVAFLIDVFWDAPRFLRIGLLSATVAGVVVIVLLRMVRPMFRRISHDELAALVESAHPEFEERLLSSLELARSADGDALKGSPMMREMLMRETVTATRNVPFDEVVDSTATVRQTIWACVAFLAVLAPFLVLQEGYGTLWARFFNPWGNHAHGMTMTLDVQPGDTVVPRGEDVSITAIPHFRFGKAKTLTSARVIWTDDEGDNEFRDLKHVPDQPALAATIPQVSRGLRYRVESDQGSSREYEIRVVDRPTISGLTVDVQPPAYCGRAAQRIDGLVGETTVFERSTLQFKATFNKPVAEVRWLWIDDVRRKYDGKPLEASGRDRLKSASLSGLAFAREDAQLLSVDAGGLSATWELPADREGAFEIVLLDSAGIQNRNEPGRSFRILRDAAPTIAWADNETQPQAKPDDVVAFEVAAEDDIGLGAVELHYSVLPHRTQAGVLKTDAAALGGLEFETRFPIDLRKLSIPEGSLIAVKARAADERPIPAPNEAWTSERVIAITKDAAAFGSSELTQRQQRIRDELAALRQEAAAREAEAAALKQKVRDAQKQGVDDSHFKSEADQLAVRSEQLGERLQQTAAEFLKEGMLATLSPKLNEVAEQDVAPAVQQAQQAREGTQDVRAPSLQKAEEELAEATQHLGQVEQRFEELAKLERDLLELNRIADKTERLADDVASFEQQRRNQAKSEAGEKQEPAKASAAQKDLESQRKELQQEQRELSKNLQDVLNRRPEVVEAARADLMGKLKDLGQRAEKLAGQEEKLSEAMKRAGEENSKSLQPEAAHQQQLRDDIEKLAAQVANEQRQRLVPTPDLSKTKEAVEQLEKGNPQAAAKAQLKAAEELEQLAKALERNQQLPADPKEAAEVLARRQQEIKDQLEKTLQQARENKTTPAADELKQLAAEQAAVQAATAQLDVPPSAENRRNEVLKEGGRALEEMLAEKPENAVGPTDRARSRLEQLAKDIGSPEDRAKRLAREADQLRKQQAEIARDLEKKRDEDRASGRKPSDNPEALADQLRKQQDVARHAAAMDTAKAADPTKAATQQSEAVRAASESLQKMQSGNTEEAAPAARAAEQALADLEKSLKNEPTSGEQLQRLVKEQREIAEAAREALKGDDAKALEQVHGRQQKQSEQLKRLDAPEAQGLAKDAAEKAGAAAKELAAAKGDAAKRPAAEQAVTEAAQSMNQLAEALKNTQPPVELARQLAADQQQRAAAAKEAASDPVPADNSGQLRTAQERVNQLQAPGAAYQKQSAAKSLDAARDSEKKLAEARQAQPADATEPTPELKAALETNAARQGEAAQALSQLAEQLAKPESEQALAQAQQQAAQLAQAARDPKSSSLGRAAQAAAQLAEDQSKLREKTEPLIDGLPDKSQQKSQMDAARSGQQKLAEQIGNLDPGVNPLAKAEAQSHARAAEKALASGDARQASEEQAAAQQSLEDVARSAQSQQAGLASKSLPQGQQSNSQPQTATSPANPDQASATPPAGEPGEATPASDLAQRARDLAAAQRQSAEKLLSQPQQSQPQQSQSPSSQLASAASPQNEPRPSDSPTQTPPTASANPGDPMSPSTSPMTGNGGSAEKSAPNSKGADADKGQGPSAQGQQQGGTPPAQSPMGSKGQPSPSDNVTQSPPTANAKPGDPMSPSTSPMTGNGGSAEKSAPNSQGSDADKGQSPSAQGKQQGPQGNQQAAPRDQSPQGSPQQDRPMNEPAGDDKGRPMGNSSDRPQSKPMQPEGEGQPMSPSPGPTSGSPGSSPPGDTASPQGAGNPPPGQTPANPTTPGNTPGGSQPGSAPGAGPGQMPGSNPQSHPSGSQSSSEMAREAVAQQQQVSQELASAALEAASQSPGSPLSQAAAKMAQSAAQASENASVGATSVAADEGRALAQTARELAKQLDENSVAQGGPQPELAERMRDLAAQQEQASGQLSQVAENRDVRNAAQAQGQQQLKEETGKLEKDFEELAEKLKAHPVDRRRQSEQARDARTRSEDASREMQQAMQTAEQGNSEAASEAARAAAAELRKAARMATEERGFEPEKSPNNPVPNETGSQVADAARQLQQAGEMLAENGPPMSGDEKGKPGEKGSKPQASDQAAQAKSKEGGEKSEGKMEPDDGGNEGLAEGQDEAPPEASEKLKQGAHSLRQAASQLKLRPGQSGDEGQQGGEQGESQPTSGQTKKGSASGAKEQLRIVDVDAHLQKLSTRNWGELPGKLQTEILQSTRKRPDGDYAPLIRRYFDTISKSQATGADRREE